MSSSRARVVQCLRSEVVLMTMMVIRLGRGLPCSALLILLLCLRVLVSVAAVSVRIPTLAKVFAVDEVV